MSSDVYPDGLDCVWLATDRELNLGVFFTGGSGPIPVGMLHDCSFAIENVEEAIENLPIVSEARLLIQVNRPDDFYDMAKKGFFVYDWQDVHRTIRECSNKYEPVASPISPITIDDLPESLKQLALRAKLLTFSFAKGQDLDIESEIECHKAV